MPKAPPRIASLISSGTEMRFALGLGECADWNGVIALDPEVIVIAACGFDLSRMREQSEQVLSRPRFHNLTASRTGRGYAMDGNAYLNRSGPRLVESLEILAHLLHPQQFENRNLTRAWDELKMSPD